MACHTAFGLKFKPMLIICNWQRCLELRYALSASVWQALFDAESRLNQRREEERRAIREFNFMQQELQRLFTSQVTMVRASNRERHHSELPVTPLRPKSRK